MKVALFGGSFDPPHIGHQIICLHLLEYERFDTVYLIPAYNHPFDKKLAAFEDRYNMCLSLAYPFNNIIVDIIESQLALKNFNNKTYTTDTVKRYIKELPHDKFTLIVGSDVLEEMDKWKDKDELNRLVSIKTYPRIAHPISGQSISSTLIRENIKAGKSIKGYVPLSVLDYIEKNGLYK